MRAHLLSPPRIATPEELRRLGVRGIRALGLLLPPIAGASPLIPADPGGQSAQQTLTFTGGPTGGSVTLSHPQAQGQSTPAIAFNAPAAPGPGVAAGDVQSALRSLPGLGSVTVAGNAGGPYTVTFPVSQSSIGNQLITLSANNLTGGTTPSMAIALAQTGILGGDEMSGSGQPAPEIPRIIGASGQPAYAAGWSSPVGQNVALTVPAAAARTDWEPAQFYVAREGFIHLEGVAVWALGAAPLITTLPTGAGAPFDYAPAQTQVGANDVEIRPDGTVNYMGSTAAAGAVQLNAEYRAKGV